MIIHTDKTGKILYEERESWVDVDWKDNGEDKDRVLSGDLTIDRVIFCIENDYLKYIALPAYYRGELFVIEQDSEYFIGDDFFSLCSLKRNITVDEQQKSFFLKKGYLPIGQTIFYEIRRLSSQTIYSFSVDGLIGVAIPIRRFSFTDESEMYSRFKETLKSILQRSLSSNNGILLSGGVDSRLLLVLLKEYIDDIKVITSASIPCFSSNASDVITAERIASLLGLKAEVSYVDYRKLTVSELDPIIRRMPLSVHGGINFFRMCQVAAQSRDITLFCGQNMDSLYNLGPTERSGFDFHGIAQWFKRFYLSEEYIRSLPDVEGRGSLSGKVIAQIGLRLFKHATHQTDLRLPSNSLELVNGFKHNNDYTVFCSNGAINDDKTDIRTAFDVKSELYKTKLSYLKGGDSQAVETGGFLTGVNIVLPYSEQSMVEYLSNIHLTITDVWKPKRYSYKYLSEFTDKYGREIATFTRPSETEMLSRFREVKDLYVVFENILTDTEYGRRLEEVAGVEASGYTGLQKYDSILRAYWFNRIIQILETEYDVKITP